MLLRRTTQTLLLSSLLMLTANAANASDLRNLLQNLTGNTYSGSSSYNNYNDNYNYSINATQVATRNNIEARISQLRSDANNAAQSGQISRNEFQNMNDDLNRIANLTANYAADGLSFGEAQAIVGMLDTAANHLTNFGYGSVSQNPFNNGNLGYQSYNPRPRNYGFSDIRERVSTLQNRMDRGIRSGKLNQSEAASCRAQLDRISRDEQIMQRGGLSNWEHQTLLSRLDQLNNQLSDDLNDNQMAGRRSRWD